MTITELRLQATASIEQLCRKYRIREMAVFGSVARAEDRGDSDVNVCALEPVGGSRCVLSLQSSSK